METVIAVVLLLYTHLGPVEIEVSFHENVVEAESMIKNLQVGGSQIQYQGHEVNFYATAEDVSGRLTSMEESK